MSWWKLYGVPFIHSRTCRVFCVLFSHGVAAWHSRWNPSNITAHLPPLRNSFCSVFHPHNRHVLVCWRRVEDGKEAERKRTRRILPCASMGRPSHHTGSVMEERLVFAFFDLHWKREALVFFFFPCSCHMTNMSLLAELSGNPPSSSPLALTTGGKWFDACHQRFWIVFTVLSYFVLYSDLHGWRNYLLKRRVQPAVQPLYINASYTYV